MTDEEIWEALQLSAPETFKMHATRGRNLIAVGWCGGVLRCCFSSKDGPHFGRYIGVPEAEKEKLLRSPYPDSLFAKIIKNKGFTYEREA